MVNIITYNNVVKTDDSDNLFLAKEILYKNLKKIGFPETTPKLEDINNTHLTFIISNYKPHISISQQYIKHKISNKYSLGSKIDIEIPNIGDYIHDIVLHIKLKYDNNGISYIKNITELDISNHLSIPKYKFCDFPGERLIKNYNFKINGKKIDEYTTNDLIFWKEFNLNNEGKRVWNKLIGHQSPIKGYNANNYSLVDLSNNSEPIKNFPIINDVSNNKLYTREYNTRIQSDIYNGLQTPKFMHNSDSMDFWIPLIFWFNKDIKASIPIMAIPFSKKILNIELCKENEIIGLTPPDNTLYNYMVSYDDISSSFVNKNYGSKAQNLGQNNLLLWDLDKWNNTELKKIYTSLDTNSLLIDNIELYINNIFIDTNIRDLFIKNIGFSLIRVYKRQTFNIYNSNDLNKKFNLSEMKWPIETMYFGLRLSQYEVEHPVYFDKWFTFGFHPEYRLCYSKYLNNYHFKTDSSGITIKYYKNSILQEKIISNTNNLFLQTINPIIFYSEYYPTINKISLISNGAKLMDKCPYSFYSNYIPWKNNVSKKNNGISMINFSFYKNKNQPSGHINVSKATNLFIKIQSNLLSSDNLFEYFWYNKNADNNNNKANSLGKLYTSATAINFLYIDNGSLLLRFNG